MGGTANRKRAAQLATSSGHCASNSSMVAYARWNRAVLATPIPNQTKMNFDEAATKPVLLVKAIHTGTRLGLLKHTACIVSELASYKLHLGPSWCWSAIIFLIFPIESFHPQVFSSPCVYMAVNQFGESCHQNSPGHINHDQSWSQFICCETSM